MTAAKSKATGDSKKDKTLVDDSDMPLEEDKIDSSLSDEDLKKRFHGAWRGRSVGCALGKPVEAKRRKPIKEFLIARNAWELTDYVPNDPPFTWCPLSTRENIAFMEPDDDIHYTLMGLVVLEKFGPDFRWNDIANSWNTHLPYYAICTAERQAIPSCDILTVWKEFKHPRHEEFSEPTRWSLLNAFTETAKKYSPARADLCYRGLTRLFGLDGREAVLWRK